jgi:hypothetical protein
MIQSRLVLTGAVATLMFGVTGAMATSNEQGATLSQENLVIAADDSAPAAGETDENAEDSAKMGDEEGTHEGPDLGATPENDTSKVDQPARRNPTTGGTPQDEGTPQDDGTPQDE